MQKQKFQSKNNIKALLQLINSHFFRSITGPFFAFGFPIIFILILGLLLGYAFVFGGLLALPAMTVSLIILPQAIFEFKNSILLKRIAVSSIKPHSFLLTILSYYCVIMILSSIFALLIGTAVFSTNWSVGSTISADGANPVVTAPPLKEYFENVNWFSLIWGILMNIIIGSAVGIFMASIAKSSMMLQGISYPILILSQFLSAQVLPIAMTKGVDALWYLSYITPFKYSTGLIIEAWNCELKIPPPDLVFPPGLPPYPGPVQISIIGSNNVFDINSSFYTMEDGNLDPVLIFNKTDKILNLVFPFIFFILFSSMSLKTFKWSVR